MYLDSIIMGFHTNFQYTGFHLQNDAIHFAAILGHLSFFLHKESPKTMDSLDRAVQIYQQSTCDTSVKQAVEKIFELENISKGSYVNHTWLAEEAVQIALNSLICMDFTIHFFYLLTTANWEL
ncbi:hypothetical protein BYT27DRAFT_7218087 [Phlegmacium glaucopus]|nr:hypothetical protein BYT27DRAFT_7218087 [Phlegmacium glaucopus]